MGAANIVAASYYIIPAGHAHSEVHRDRDVGRVGKDELDVLKFPTSSPGFC